MSLFRTHVLIAMDTPSILKGARLVKDKLMEALVKRGLQNEVKVLETGSLSSYAKGVMMVVYPEGVHYCNVTPENVQAIVDEHLYKGRIYKPLLFSSLEEKQSVTITKDSGFARPQTRVVLRNCGLIDPDSIEEYIANGGYEGLGVALTTKNPKEVIQEVKDSGLRGRGGAGFPTGLKWSFTSEGDEKFIVCNADEGEPGTFKDRLIMEGDPHAVLEGMAIAGYAVGANRGFIYIRGEYTLSIQRLRTAINQARQLGLLGKNIFDSGFDFDIELRFGAGAYVCGEETALIESIEGSRGNPRFKPPYPGQAGLWDKPTVVNNVETLANVPQILAKGSDWFKTLAKPNSKCTGTKVFTLTGHVNNAGLIEVPMGTTLREVIYEYGEGIPGGHAFKFAQTGGTAGGCVTEAQLDVPMDYDSMAEAGTALGSGAMLIMDDTTCPVDMAYSFIHFFRHESCGKCIPCREGNYQLEQIFEKLVHGEASLEELNSILPLAETMRETSLCALGQSPIVPLRNLLNFFKAEFEAHATQKKCPTGVCSMKPRKKQKRKARI